MQISIAGQAYAFVWSVIGGMLAALLFDIFRVKRKTLHSGRMLTFFEDLLYWIVVSVIMLGVMVLYNDGEVRGYIFVGAAIGAVLYALLLSRIFSPVFSAFFSVLSELFRVASLPVKVLARLMHRIFGKVRRKARMKASGMSVSFRLFRRFIRKI